MAVVVRGVFLPSYCFFWRRMCAMQTAKRNMHHGFYDEEAQNALGRYWVSMSLPFMLSDFGESK
jgi:hypothetical protein